MYDSKFKIDKNTNKQQFCTIIIFYENNLYIK